VSTGPLSVDQQDHHEMFTSLKLHSKNAHLKNTHFLVIDTPFKRLHHFRQLYRWSNNTQFKDRTADWPWWRQHNERLV